MIKIITERISEDDLLSFLGHPYQEMIKFVVDLKNKKMALGGELHADGESLLLKEGSKQADVWGANYHPKRKGDEKIEFTALINIRPSFNNMALEIQDVSIRNQVKKIVSQLLP